MQTNQRIRIAIQKKGRLNLESDALLKQCGLRFSKTQNSLVSRCKNLPIDLLLVRDDDIPTMVMDKACDLGIVGENVLFEKKLLRQSKNKDSRYIKLLNCQFGQCRLSIATPRDVVDKGELYLENANIATSYPFLLQAYLNNIKIKANIIEISGSVELMPNLGLADAICDLVSTGKTLEENQLIEQAVILDSQAVVIQSSKLLTEKQQTIVELLLRRMNSVIAARNCKYIVFHAPKKTLQNISVVLPGIEAPTVLPLEGEPDKVAVQLVSSEAVFWNTLETIKAMGASSILVLPIEKMMR